jgi:hypothetical protein
VIVASCVIRWPGAFGSIGGCPGRAKAERRRRIGMITSRERRWPGVL